MCVHYKIQQKKLISPAFNREYMCVKVKRLDTIDEPKFKIVCILYFVVAAHTAPVLWPSLKRNMREAAREKREREKE